MEDFQFGDDIFEAEKSRTKCTRCKRPHTVCICYSLPSSAKNLTRSRLTILQHPREYTRPLHTTSILELCISDESFKIYRGTRFPASKFEDLYATMNQSKNVLLYPRPGAFPIDQFKCPAGHTPDTYNIVLLDGTWQQAQDMYKRNKFLHSLETVIITEQADSEYVIRTQPGEKCLSTIECAAISLQHFEEDATIKEMLLRPLRAMCQFQLAHGQQVHQPKSKR